MAINVGSAVMNPTTNNTRRNKNSKGVKNEKKGQEHTQCRLYTIIIIKNTKKSLPITPAKGGQEIQG